MTLRSTDIDECELKTDNCHVNATCADVIGSFDCTCNSGFEGNGVNCTSKKLSLPIEGMPHLCHGFSCYNE